MGAEAMTRSQLHATRVVGQIRMILQAADLYWPPQEKLVLGVGDVERLANFILQAHGQRVWTEFALIDWPALCAGYLEHSKEFRPDQRRDIVKMLAPHMTSEEIAVFFDVDIDMIVRDRG